MRPEDRKEPGERRAVFWRLAERNGFEFFVVNKDLVLPQTGQRQEPRHRAGTWGRGLMSFSPEINLSEQVTRGRGLRLERPDQEADRRQGPEGRRAGARTEARVRQEARKRRGEAAGDLQGRGTTLRVREPVFSQQEADRRARAILKRRAEGFVGGRGESIGIPEIQRERQRRAERSRVSVQHDVLHPAGHAHRRRVGLPDDVRGEGHDDMSDAVRLAKADDAGERGIVRGVSVGIVAQEQGSRRPRPRQDPFPLAREPRRVPLGAHRGADGRARAVAPGSFPKSTTKCSSPSTPSASSIRTSLGCLWNGQDPPPESNGDGRNDLRMIRSRSGHEIVFDDGAQGRIEIHLKDDTRTVRLDPDGIEIEDDSGNKIAIVVDAGQHRDQEQRQHLDRVDDASTSRPTRR